MKTIKILNNISDVIYTGLSKDKYNFVTEGDNYDAILLRSANIKETDFPDSLIAISRAGIGVDNIPVERCAENGCVVFNTPGANANAVKELVICGMMLAGRRIVSGVEWALQQHESGASEISKNAEKAKKNFVGREIAGKKLGVIGLGAIGVIVANAAIALDMEVVGYDPYLSVNSALRLSRNVQIRNSLEELLSECDFVTMHLHLTEKTKGMIGEKELALMKDDAVVLNYARSGLVDNKAMLAALDSGKIGKYVTDFPDDELVGNPNVIATPHLGASTPEAEENCARMAAKQLNDYLVNGNIVNSVNFPDCEIPRGEGYRICIINKNVANMIGQFTAVLAAEGQNIEHMMNRSRGAYAYNIIDVSEKPSEASVNKISAIDGVVKVRVLD